jgi:hypothetical protein
VRRSSDNAEKDFTASEMGAALEDWVAEEQAGWNVQPTWDVNTGDASITSQSSTETTSTVSFITTSGVSGIRQSSKPNHIVASSGDNVEINLDVSGLENDMRLRLSPSGSNVASITFENISNGYNQTFSGTLIEDAGYIRFLDLDATSGATITINSVKVTGKTGFVETWYDQSGSGNDATQTVAAKQPKIVDAGVLVSGGLDFDGVDDTFTLTSALTIDPSASGFASFISCVFDKNATGSSQVLIRNRNSNPKHVIAFNTTGTYRYNLNDGTNNLFADTVSDYGDNSLRLFSTTITGQSSTGLTHFVNGAQDSQHDTSLIGDTGSSIGQISWAAFPFGGSVKELIIYPSDQSANRVAIEANINNQYDIY